MKRKELCWFFCREHSFTFLGKGVEDCPRCRPIKESMARLKAAIFRSKKNDRAS